MTIDAIKENDIVALLTEMLEQGLRRGEVGTVIGVFEANEHHPAGYMLEFVDDETGEVYASAEITDATQIVKLHRGKRAA
ncbi:MAG TPA: DUF4926 domain-containing protein [Pyrinomonadaceae bacterium]|jgi:uncharacterized protein (DUF2164 family)